MKLFLFNKNIRAFTLAETLITLVIIGVVAALAGPAISNIMPNKNKVLFMKHYTTVANFAADSRAKVTVVISQTDDGPKY